MGLAWVEEGHVVVGEGAGFGAGGEVEGVEGGGFEGGCG